MTPEDAATQDEEETVITRVWMSTTLCLTFLTLNSIAFACAAWGVPAFRGAARAAGIGEFPALARLAFALGDVVRASTLASLAAFVALQLGAVALQALDPNRDRTWRVFLAASVVPFLWTALSVAGGLLAIQAVG
ncbi:MAG: hypothetical protein L0216_02995 [Planctomycetales bacterium]|nr:hypothetical protein [Planctomycetales bacterium]